MVSLGHNELRPEQNSWRDDDILSWVFLKEDSCILIDNLLKLVPEGPNDNESALDQINISSQEILNLKLQIFWWIGVFCSTVG